MIAASEITKKSCCQGKKVRILKTFPTKKGDIFLLETRWRVLIDGPPGKVWTIKSNSQANSQYFNVN